MQTQGKSALGGVRSLAQGYSGKRKDSPSLPWKLPEKKSSSAAKPCPVQPQAQAGTWVPEVSQHKHKAKRGTRRLLSLSLGQQPWTEPRVTKGSRGQLQQPPQGSALQGLPGAAAWWPSPRLGSRIIFRPSQALGDTV